MMIRQILCLLVIVALSNQGELSSNMKVNIDLRKLPTVMTNLQNTIRSRVVNHSIPLEQNKQDLKYYLENPFIDELMWGESKDDNRVIMKNQKFYLNF